MEGWGGVNRLSADWGEKNGGGGRPAMSSARLGCVLRSVRGKGTKVANSDLPSEAIMKSLSGDGLAGVTRGDANVDGRR